jgi:hypothetical protein
VSLLDDEDVDHGICRADTARALAWWQRLGASTEATDMLHWVMCLEPYPPGGMVVAFTINFITYF